MKFYLLMLVAFASLTMQAQIKVKTEYPPVILAGTQYLEFKSSLNKQAYTVSIQVPASYKQNPSRRYPVLYLLDGQWSFAPALGLLGGLNYDGLVQEVIIVAIGWPDNFDSSRARDLTPTSIPSAPLSGGAPEFLKVIKNEVRPFVNLNYQVDTTKNILAGGSYGGLFALYTLFHEPGLFQGYIIGSPSIDFDNSIVNRYEKAFSEAHRPLKAKVFFHWGQFEQEFIPQYGLDNFVNQLKTRKYEGLEVESLIVDKMSHASNGAYGMGRGLQFVLESPDIIVDKEILDQYVGKYEEDVEITRDGKYLYLNLPGFTSRFHAVTDNLFYVPGLPGTGEFVKDPSGKVVSYCVRFGGNVMLAKRLK